MTPCSLSRPTSHISTSSISRFDRAENAPVAVGPDATPSQAAVEEFGDILFALVNVARWEGIDAEEALAASNRKFRRRWAAK